MKMTEFFTNGIVDFLVNSFTGDYINFQQALENLNGPHPAVHEIIGGDMAGKCPFGLEPPRCYFGPKWASNGEQKRQLNVYFLLIDANCPTQILRSSFTILFVTALAPLKKGLIYPLCRCLIRFGTIGKTETRATSTRLQGVPSVGRSTKTSRLPSTLTVHLLGSMYVATLVDASL